MKSLQIGNQTAQSQQTTSVSEPFVAQLTSSGSCDWINLGSTGTFNSREDLKANIDIGYDGQDFVLNTTYYDWDVNINHLLTDKLRPEETVVVVYDGYGNTYEMWRIHRGEVRSGAQFGPFPNCQFEYVPTW